MPMGVGARLPELLQTNGGVAIYMGGGRAWRYAALLFWSASPPVHVEAPMRPPVSSAPCARLLSAAISEG